MVGRVSGAVRTAPLLVGCAVLLQAGLLHAKPFRASLADFGTKKCAWVRATGVGKGAAGTAAQAPGKDGSPGVKLTSVRRSMNLGAATQTVTLKPGLYEITVWARGTGQLVLRAGRAVRYQPLGKAWALYGFLFEAKQEPVALMIGVYSMIDRNPQATISRPTLAPATDDHRKAWRAWQSSYTQLGFYVGDPQRPAPGGRSGRCVPSACWTR